MLKNTEKGFTFISHHRYHSEISNASDIRLERVKMFLKKFIKTVQILSRESNIKRTLDIK